MNAKIGVKTPAGKSLEGFPQELDIYMGFELYIDQLNEAILYDDVCNRPLSNTTLHPGRRYHH